MHIEINLLLQNISSNVKRDVMPEEIDWLINKSIKEFIDGKLTIDPNEKQESFQQSGVDLTSLSSLIVLDKVMPVHLSNLYPTEKTSFVQLPANFMYLLDDGASGVVRNCDATFTVATTAINRPEFVYSLKVPKTTKTSSPFYENAQLNYSSSATNAKFPVSLPDKDMNFVIQECLRNYLVINQSVEFSNVEVYWERYKNLYLPESLIFVASMSLQPITLTFDGLTTTAVLVTNGNIKVPGTYASTLFVENRLVKSNLVNRYRGSSFLKSTSKSTLVSFQNETLKVYYDDLFIVNNIRLSYIRKPQTVNLALGYNCDLPVSVHPDICSLVVEKIKLTIGDPSYEATAQNNLRHK